MGSFYLCSFHWVCRGRRRKKKKRRRGRAREEEWGGEEGEMLEEGKGPLTDIIGRILTL